MSPERFLVGATTYNPGPDVALEVVQRLVGTGLPTMVYDNSTSPAEAEVVAAACELHGVPLRTGGSNVGTAGALNCLLDEAADQGREWLLYLDQDSEPGPGFVARMLEVAGGVDDTVALVGSRVVHREHHDPSRDLVQRVEPTRFLISSGTAMRVSALRGLGGYDERFFLDLVDREMCLRVRRAGLQIVEDQGRTIEHDIGVGSRAVLGGRIHISKHPWWRRRLMWQNSIMLSRRYVRQFPDESIRLLGGRVIETLAATIYFRDVRFLTTAAQGAWDGVRGGRRTYM